MALPTPLKFHQLRIKAAEIAINLDTAAEQRKTALVTELKFWNSAKAENEVQRQMKMVAIKQIAIEIRQIDEGIEWSKKPPREGEITQEMIQRAKDYPIDGLIEFVRGSAIAWCHDDKTPSLRHFKKTILQPVSLAESRLIPLAS